MKNIFKLLLGLVVSFTFLYFTFSEVNFSNIGLQLTEVRPQFLLYALIVCLLTLYLRSLRWGYILRSTFIFNQKFLLPVSSVGIAAITILPLRLGEIVRPLLISKNSNIKFSSALASIVFERIIDAFMIITVLSIVIIFSSVPDWVYKAGIGLLFSISLILLMIIFVYFNKDKTEVIFSRLSIVFPVRLVKLIQVAFNSFLIGLSILSKPLDMLIAVLISIFIWLNYGLIVYLMFYFHSFDLPIIAAYSVVVLTFLATSLPAAPGFLGTFQYGSFLALTSYGVSVDAAAFFSLSYYLVMIGMNILLGLIFFPMVNLDGKFLDWKNKVNSL
jgi:glycosyltransferase 2 family protein